MYECETKVLTSNESGDHVNCLNCLNIMLVDIGEERCPICNEYSMMMWVDSERMERLAEDFK